MNFRSIISPTGGIPQERVSSCPGNQEELFKTLECNVCKRIAFNPRECSKCKCTVCLYCLTEYNKEHNMVDLPHCPQEGCSGGEFGFNQLGVVMLNLLEFRCHNEKCGEKLKYENIDKHECAYDYFKCEAPDCNREYVRYEIDNHEDTCPKMPKDCPYQVHGCDRVILRENIHMHQEECKFKPFSCDKCGLNPIFKKDLEEHEAVCPMGEVVCEECQTEMEREELAQHSCTKSIIRKIGIMQDWIDIKENVLERILYHEHILEEAKIIDIKKYKIIDERISKIESREKYIEDATQILLSKQTLIDGKLESIQKRESDLESSNMAYLHNSQELLQRLKVMEEREASIEQRNQKNNEELQQKMINIEDREKALEKAVQINAENYEKNEIKLKEIEERGILQEKSNA